MSRTLHPSTIVPPGFRVESAVDDGAVTIITVRHTGKSSSCPGCAADAERVHSRYSRRLADLPLGGRQVALAASKAFPSAMQVADRWHLMENASHAFLEMSTSH